MDTTQNLLKLLQSVDEKSVAVGLEIHKANPTPESSALLEDYLVLYRLLNRHQTIQSLEAQHIATLNEQEFLNWAMQKIDNFPVEIFCPVGGV